MSAPQKGLAHYKEELVRTANAIASPGRGILAADESTGTIGKRFDKIQLPNTEPNRRAYRELLFTAPGWGQYCSGTILYEETLYQKTEDGTPFVEILKKEGVISIYPLDVVRRQMQTIGMKSGHENFHTKIWPALQQIVKNDGMRGLYKGLSINYWRAGPQAAVTFATYDFVKKFLDTL